MKSQNDSTTRIKKIMFSNEGWEDYEYLQKVHPKQFKKLSALIKQCRRTPFEGEGKPEELKYDLSGYWSRRIDRENRLVYCVSEDPDDSNSSILYIIQCRYHY